MLNLDTHVLIDAVRNTLPTSENALLQNEEWSVSSIVFWEIAKLAQFERIEFDFGDRDVARVIEQLHVWPINPDVAKTSTQLDFYSDPADELIAATSIVYGIPLVTRDRTIRRSKLVPLAT